MRDYKLSLKDMTEIGALQWAKGRGCNTLLSYLKKGDRFKFSPDDTTIKIYSSSCWFTIENDVNQKHYRSGRLCGVVKLEEKY